MTQRQTFTPFEAAADRRQLQCSHQNKPPSKIEGGSSFLSPAPARLKKGFADPHAKNQHSDITRVSRC